MAHRRFRLSQRPAPHFAGGSANLRLRARPRLSQADPKILRYYKEY